MRSRTNRQILRKLLRRKYRDNPYVPLDAYRLQTAFRLSHLSLHTLAMAIAESRQSYSRQNLHHLIQRGTRCRARLRRALSRVLKVPDEWLAGAQGTFELHGVPSLHLKGRFVSWGVWFPGTQEEILATSPGTRGYHFLERIVEAAARLGSVDSDPKGIVFPPVPVGQIIDAMLQLVAKEWHRELGRLDRLERQKILAAWLKAWVVTLEYAGKVPRSGAPKR